MAAGLVSLMLGLGASSAGLAAPNGAMAGCSDAAVLAAIDGKETRTINENKMPGSGLALSSLPSLPAIQIIGHQIEVLGGQPTRDPNTAICQVKMHVTARTSQGLKEAEEDFIYRIEQLATDLAVTFCPNRQCPDEAATVTLKTSQNQQLIR
jgi:hypothetical protein